MSFVQTKSILIPLISVSVVVLMSVNLFLSPYDRKYILLDIQSEKNGDAITVALFVNIVSLLLLLFSWRLVLEKKKLLLIQWSILTIVNVCLLIFWIVQYLS